MALRRRLVVINEVLLCNYDFAVGIFHSFRLWVDALIAVRSYGCMDLLKS
jgi:hypothetical protein